MAQATSYGITSVQGAREDLSNQLKRVAPEDTPMYSLLPQSAAPKAVETSWVADTLDNPSFGTPPIDGADLSFPSASYTDEIANRVRLGNLIQTFQRQSSVSPIAEAIDVSGPQTSLLAASKARVLTQLKTDIEGAIGSSNVQSAGSSTAGSKMSGLLHVTDPASTSGFFSTTAKQGFRSVSGSRHGSGTLTEGAFRTVVQSIYEAGGKAQNYRLFCGSSIMNALTGFSRATNIVGGTQANFDANIQGTTLTLSVVEIIGDYGKIVVIPDLFINRTSGSGLTALSKKSGVLIPEDDNVSLKMLQPISVQDLPDVGGGGERFLTRAILTLCVLNPRALGSIISV